MPSRFSLARMVEMIRNRQLSSSELVQAHFRQIIKLRPILNAFVETYEQDALAQARHCDDSPATGPLHGIPVTVKDSFAMAGRPHSVGSVLLKEQIATVDAVIVERLRAAGAIIIGRTNTPEFLYNYETDNYLTGCTNNPWEPRVTAGGSSGGEAAAIASYCSAGGVGSDGGGSIREPAHFCGICGLKPTPGRIPAYGHWPEIAHPAGFMGVAGPMARTVRDVKILFDALQGYDPRDPFSVPFTPGPPEIVGCRIHIMEQFNQVPVQPVMRKAVRLAAKCLSQLGFPSQPFDAVPLAKAPNLWLFLFGELPAAILRPMLEGRLDDCHRTGIEFYSHYREQPPPSAQRIVEVLGERDCMRAALLTSLPTNTVILAPACGVTAFPHRSRRYSTDGKDIGLFEAMMPLTPWNLLGMPSMVVPMLISDDGLPAGVQLIGHPYQEELLLELADRLEAARGPLPGPPNL